MARRSRPAANTGPPSPKRMAAYATGMSVPDADGWLTSRRRDTPAVLASSSNCSIFLRVSLVTVSAQRRPTQLSELGISGRAPRATSRITPSGPITRAMSLAMDAKADAISGARVDSTPSLSASEGCFANECLLGSVKFTRIAFTRAQVICISRDFTTGPRDRTARPRPSRPGPARLERSAQVAHGRKATGAPRNDDAGERIRPAAPG